MSYATLTYDVRDATAWIGLNRPHKRNAFTVDMFRELSEAYAAADGDESVRCSVVFAHGDHFTAGLDLADFAPKVMSGEALFPAGGLDPLDLHEPARRKPVVLAAHGYCYTIGIELLLGADVRLCAEDTQFKQMEVQRGIMAFGGATIRLPQVAGWGNAMAILLTGDAFSAADYFRFGIVQEVATRAELLPRAAHWARRIAAQAPLAVQATRRNARLALTHGPDAAHADTIAVRQALMRSADAAEGVASFLERREARFVGR